MNFTEALHIYLEDCHKYPDECKNCPLSGGEADADDLCFRLTSLGREFEEKKLLTAQCSYGRKID